jgi:hypothetical protein
MQAIKLKDIKKGTFFTLKNYGEYPPESRVYVRGDYERSEKKYSCYKFTNVNAESFFKSNRLVFVGFTF